MVQGTSSRIHFRISRSASAGRGTAESRLRHFVGRRVPFCGARRVRTPSSLSGGGGSGGVARGASFERRAGATPSGVGRGRQRAQGSDALCGVVEGLQPGGASVPSGFGPWDGPGLVRDSTAVGRKRGCFGSERGVPVVNGCLSPQGAQRTRGGFEVDWVTCWAISPGSIGLFVAGNGCGDATDSLADQNPEVERRRSKVVATRRRALEQRREGTESGCSRCLRAACVTANGCQRGKRFEGCLRSGESTPRDLRVPA